MELHLKVLLEVSEVQCEMQQKPIKTQFALDLNSELSSNLYYPVLPTPLNPHDRLALGETEYPFLLVVCWGY